MCDRLDEAALRLGKRTASRTAAPDTPLVVAQIESLIEYEWPTGSGEYFFIQVSSLLNAKFFVILLSACL